MKSVKELVQENIDQSSLNILVFGPQVKQIQPEGKTRDLQLKRIQIRERLEAEGHNVNYAEDLYDSSLPHPYDNAVYQEILMMKECDLIITLVESPGSITEATLICKDQSFSFKSALFMDRDFREGLAAEACRLAETAGATFQYYDYPADLVECHLLGHVKEKVRRVQLVGMIC